MVLAGKAPRQQELSAPHLMCMGPFVTALSPESQVKTASSVVILQV